MSLLDVVFWICGIRGHIPRNDDFRAGPGQSPLAASRNPLLLILAAFVVTAILLSLVLWGALWLEIKLP